MMVLLTVSDDNLHAWAGLETARTRLLGPLGLATLDKEDWAYRGDYDNGDRGGDPAVAHGANYHQVRGSL